MPAPTEYPSFIGAPTITYNSVEIEFELEKTTETDTWLKTIIEREKCRLLSLNFIFCSDDYLHRLNVEYLNHDTLTDVITFPYASRPFIEGDIFISLDRVRENAKKFGEPLLSELYRVMAHGVLHLCGYGDKSDTEVKLMRSKEDDALGLWTK